MTTLLLAAKAALEAMQPVASYGHVGSKDTEQAALQGAITALRTAIAEAEKPVAVIKQSAIFNSPIIVAYEDAYHLLTIGAELYLAPQTQPASLPDQEPLGADFAKVLHDNLGDLYESESPQAQPAKSEI